jgi:ketosteroid isomerase-like protein
MRMRDLLSLTAVTVFACAPTCLAAKGAGADKEDGVKQAYHEYAAAFRARDRIALDRLVADDAVFVAEHRWDALTKRQLLEEPTYISAEASAPPTLDDTQVRIFGDAAVIYGRGVTVFRDTRGREVSRRLRVSATFIKHGERWQLAAMHTSTLR